MHYILPVTEDPRQVFTLDLTIDGEPFHARVEVRYLPAPDCWVISVWDNSSAAKHTGSTGQIQSVTGDALRQMLKRAGIAIGD